MKNKKSLFIHDYFQNMGGGEKLILSLIKNEDNLITSFVDNKILKFLNKKKIRILQNNQKVSLKIKKILTPFYFNYSSNSYVYKNCVISGNYSVFFNLSKVKNKIFYCHSLPKIFFDYENFYSTNLLYKFIIKLIGVFFKKIYIKRISKFNHIIANSNYTKNKLSKFIKKKILVIYPPIENFRYSKNGKYFLSNSRHEIDKNIDKIIRAFNNNKKYRLLITSQGSETKRLKKLAGSNNKIIFLGLKSKNEYKKILTNCISTINVGENEDFGMSAIETMAAGKPPIVINTGGYKETCKNNYNSFFLNKKNIEKDLTHMLKKFNQSKFIKLHSNCIKTSKRFDSKNFKKNLYKLFI